MRWTVMAILAVALAGCGQRAAENDGMRGRTDQELSAVAMDAPAEAAGRADAAKPSPPANEIKVSLPQIAYVFDYGFRVPAGEIPALQRAHADLCEAKGPTACRILNMSQSSDQGDYAQATLQLEIAAPRARVFGGELTKAAEAKGGEPVSSAIKGEDLSKQIVDTEARIRARTALRDRLMEVLQTRKGTVAELVEAERGVAQVNEELDQAQSWLAEMRGRVAFSKVTIDYLSGAPSAGGFVEPIRDAIGNIGPILGVVIGGLIMLVTLLLPVAAIGLLVALAVRAIRRRRRPADPIVRDETQAPPSPTPPPA